MTAAGEIAGGRPECGKKAAQVRTGWTDLDGKRTNGRKEPGRRRRLPISPPGDRGFRQPPNIQNLSHPGKRSFLRLRFERCYARRLLSGLLKVQQHRRTLRAPRARWRAVVVANPCRGRCCARSRVREHHHGRAAVVKGGDPEATFRLRETAKRGLPRLCSPASSARGSYGNVCSIPLSVLPLDKLHF